ncbi:MAG: ATP-binding protein, partial [Leptospiraceae bacterium]|nr:ATP-binding protein [Leptospiraceae bacterium]
ALELIDQTSEELREIYSNLYPSVLKELGLETALRSLIKNMFPESIEIEWEYKIHLEPKEEVKLGIYRVLQEICANITKHSQATQVWFRFFSTKSKIFIEVDDNGVGFDLTRKTNRKGLGLNNIKFRIEGLGGNFEIYSAPSKGVSIQIRLPL